MDGNHCHSCSILFSFSLNANSQQQQTQKILKKKKSILKGFHQKITIALSIQLYVNRSSSLCQYHIQKLNLGTPAFCFMQCLPVEQRMFPCCTVGHASSW